jgi:hypothetical protein
MTFEFQEFICDRCPTMPPETDPDKPPVISRLYPDYIPVISRFTGTKEDALSLGWRSWGLKLLCPQCAIEVYGADYD